MSRGASLPPLPMQTIPQRRSAGFTALRIFLPFALGYALSYLYRTVNAVLAPVLGGELGVDAAATGFITGAYFFAFAAVQIPLGMALDRFGPRRTQAVLLTVAAAGAALFSLGTSTAQLAAARGLIGAGVAGCLLASFKLFALWLPKEQLPFANGLLLACGGLGVMAASSPVEAATAAMGWRPLFQLLAAATVAVALLIGLVVPERRAAGEPRGLAQQLWGIAFILRARPFWRVAPLAMTAQAAWMSIQALWFGVWLRDVAGLGARAAADTLFVGGFAMAAGYAGLGWLAWRLGRAGVPVNRIAAAATAAFIAVQALLALDAPLPPWLLVAAFACSGGAPTIFYAALTQKFPIALAGRVNTSLALPVFMLAGLLQLGTGAVLDLFATPAAGYLAAFGGWTLLQAACFVWFLVWRDDRLPIDKSQGGGAS